MQLKIGVGGLRLVFDETTFKTLDEEFDYIDDVLYNNRKDENFHGERTFLKTLWASAEGRVQPFASRSLFESALRLTRKAKAPTYLEVMECIECALPLLHECYIDMGIPESAIIHNKIAFEVQTNVDGWSQPIRRFYYGQVNYLSNEKTCMPITHMCVVVPGKSPIHTVPLSDLRPYEFDNVKAVCRSMKMVENNLLRSERQVRRAARIIR